MRYLKIKMTFYERILALFGLINENKIKEILLDNCEITKSKILFNSFHNSNELKSDNIKENLENQKVLEDLKTIPFFDFDNSKNIKTNF